MREKATTLLDLIAVLLVTAGLIGSLWGVLGPAALCAGGLLLLLSSMVASHRSAPSKAETP